MKKSKELMLRFLAISLLFFSIIGLIFYLFWGSWAIYISVFLYLIVAVVTVVKAWTQVPHKWVYLVERFGDFYEVLKPGLHFVFPWLGFFEVKHRVFTGIMKLPLFDEEIEETEDYKGGIVDFKDESAKIQSFFFFQVSKFSMSEGEKKREKASGKSDKEIEEMEWTDQVKLYKKAAYETADPITYIKASAEAALRSFLAQYDLFEANQLKSNFDLNEVALMKKPSEVRKEKAEGEANKETKTKENEWRKSRFGKKLLSWGFTPTSFTITEIQFPERVIEQRARKMKAEQDVKIADRERKVIVKHSKGEAEALDNLSVARAVEVKKLVDENGMSVQEAIKFVTDRRKYEAVSNVKKAIFFEGENSNSKKGAEMGAGFGSVIDDKKEGGR